MIDPAGDTSLEIIEELPSNCTARLIQVECTQFYDATFHRHYLKMGQEEEISVSYFRDLIEAQLNIPSSERSQII